MKFSRLFLNRLQNLQHSEDTVVVIDVLRSFTTAAVALARGAAAVYPVDGIAASCAAACCSASSATVRSLWSSQRTS